jgi:phage recombination protein Bet
MNNEIAVADSGAVATRGAARSAIALRPDQTEFTPMQVAALRQLGIQDAPEGDLRVFFHRCQTTGLDPFAKQIHMIGRNTKVTEWIDNRRHERWEVKYTIQTGIDGYRVLGNRLADEHGDDLDHDEALWCGKDGQWVDIWLDSENPPVAAKYVIRKNGKPFIAKAIYTEYVQTNSDGSPNSTWKKRPAGQLAKCAEAAAWRMAYPQDFSGLQLSDAVQVIEPDGSPVERVRATSQRVNAADILAEDVPPVGPGAASRNDVYAGAERVKAAADAAAECARRAQASESSAKPEDAEAEAPAADPPMTKIQQRKIGRLMGERGIASDAAILAEIGRFLGREVAAPADVTRGEAIRFLEHLENNPPAAASKEGAKPDNPQVEEPAKASPVAEKWERARVLLDQLGADTDEKKLMFPRNFLGRDDLTDPLSLTEADMDAVVAELEQLIADEQAGQLPIDTEAAGQ